MSDFTRGQADFVLAIQLRDNANHYQRIATADRLLSNREWVQAPDGGGGNEEKAITILEDKCLADLCGVLSLPQLLEIYHNVPNEEDWKKNHYNFRRIWAQWKSNQQGQKTAKPKKMIAKVATVKDMPTFSLMSHGEKNVAYANAIKIATKSQSEIEKLREENTRLRDEVAILTKENRELRKIRGDERKIA